MTPQTKSPAPEEQSCADLSDNIAFVTEINVPGNSEPPQTAENTVLHAENAATQTATTSPPPAPHALSYRRPSEIIAMECDNADNLLGDRLLAKGQWLSILGEGGLGKSRLLLFLAVCCILGRNFFGISVHCKMVRWLILQAENSNSRVKSDLLALRNWVGEEDWQIVDEHLIIHTLETSEDGYLSLDDQEVFNKVTTLIAKTKPDIIGLDSLYCFTTGDLNADQAMRAACVRISKACFHENPKRAVVLLHHAATGRDGAAKAIGYDRSSFGRNSKVLMAYVRAQINIALASETEDGVLLIACGKNNNGQLFDPFVVRLDPETLIYHLDPDVDIADWDRRIKSKNPRKTFDLGAVVKAAEGGKTKSELVAALKGVGIRQSTAYKKIDAADAAGRITLDEQSGKYSPA